MRPHLWREHDLRHIIEPGGERGRHPGLGPHLTARRRPTPTDRSACRALGAGLCRRGEGILL